LDAKSLQHLVEHLAVLRRDGDADVELLRPRLHVQDDGAELYGFRAGAENEQSFQHAADRAKNLGLNGDGK
jgi:hypothetical protein